jgi:CubicO group peptidase (beta-lactamase class C family)
MTKTSRTMALAAACALAAVPAAHAQESSLAAHPRVHQALQLMEVWLDAQRDYLQIPGLSVGVVHDQQLIWSAGFGFAHREHQVAATPSTLYSICSISKLFTSIAVMQQRDEGRLRLDDPVGRHLDWFSIRRTEPDAPEITIANILTHSSGLPRESDHGYWTGPEFLFPTREQIIQRIASQETLYPADQFFQYSNLGLTLAGEIVAAASGMPYEQYIRQRVLEPLGLRSTYAEMPEQHRGGRLATGYTAMERDGTRKPVAFFASRGIAPAAGYASSVEDLASFASWQFGVLDRRGGENVLQRNTLREMQRVHWVDPDMETMSGLGFWISRRAGTTFTGHGGSCPGFRSQLLTDNEGRIAIILLANAQGVAARQFADRLYDIVAPALKAARDTAQVARPGRPSLAPYTGTYTIGFSGETAIVEWEDGLAAIDLPSMDPVEGLIKLRPVGEHTFRRVRKDGSLGEPVVFELDTDGRAAHMRWHSNLFRRLR